MGAAVSVRNLRKIYRAPRFRRGRTVVALAGVTLEVEPGRIFGLLGPNGAGKSTLVKILLGIVPPTGGEAAILGRPAGDPEARREVGYQPEDARLPDYHTGGSFLRYCGGLCGLSGADLSRGAREALAQVGLAEWEREKIGKYSKGMRQRLCLAQALLARPRVLFLDEPTDGLDPLGRILVRDRLLALRREGCTVFVNSHLLAEVEAVCDRVAILRTGSVVAEGTIESLTTKGGEYEIEVEGWNEEAGRALAGAVGRLERKDERTLRVRVPSPEGIDAVLDFLRSRGVGIRRLERRRATLEEAFVALVGTKPEPRDSGPGTRNPGPGTRD